MDISRIAEGEIPQRYKGAGSALAKRLAAIDKAEASQTARRAQQVQGAQAVQETQSAQEAQRVSFAEMISQAQQAQKAQPAEKPDSAAQGLVGESSLKMLAASETQMARVVSGWK